MESNLNIISAIPLFNGLPADQLSAIRQIAVEKRFNKGQVIFSEGDETKGFFVVVDALEAALRFTRFRRRGKNKFCIYSKPASLLEK